MPAKSQKQQKLFGLALAVKRGEVPKSDVSSDVKAIADDMPEKKIRDFAKTKRRDLPVRVKNEIAKLVREALREIVIEGRVSAKHKRGGRA